MATRIDAIGTIFGGWTMPELRPWLLERDRHFRAAAVHARLRPADRELRSGFGLLYHAYDAIFSGLRDDGRAWLFHRTAERWYAHAAAGDA